MAEIKNTEMIRDALGSPIPQKWDEESQTFIASTVDGSAANVDFSKTKMIRDRLGSPIPQKWDNDAGKFVPSAGGVDGEVTIESIPGLQTELNETAVKLAEEAQKVEALNADKASKSEARLKTETIGLNDADAELLAAIQNKEGETIFNLESEPRANSVTPEKTTMIKRGRSILDKKSAIQGITINNFGIEEANLSFATTPMRDIKPQTTFITNRDVRVSRYNSEGVWIATTAFAAGSTFSSGTATQVRFSYSLSFHKDIQVQEGTVLIDSPYGLYIENLKDDSDKVAKIMQNRIVPKKSNAEYNTFDLLKNTANFTTSNLIVEDNYEIAWRTESQSLKLMTNGQATPYLRGNFASVQTIAGISEIVVAVFIPNVMNIIKIDLRMFHQEGGFWERTSGALKNGWNIIRYVAANGVFGNWVNFDHWRLYIYTTGKTEFYLAKVTAVMPHKAKILFVNDHGYSNFKNTAFPLLKAQKIPVTFAINPGRLGNEIGILTEAEIDELALDPYAEFNFHAWNPSEKATSDMTPDELRADTIKCMRFLQRKGIQPQHWWRSVFVQNLATNAVAIKDMVEAYSTPIQSGGNEVYPFLDRYNINRSQVHGRDSAWFDELFNKLKKTRGVAILYTHDIHETDPIDMKSSELAYLITKIEQANAEGWLEGVTFDSLKNRYSKIINVYDLPSYVDTL